MTSILTMPAVAVVGGWDLGNFLQSAKTTLETWGGYFVTLIGVVMIIAAVYQIAKGLMSHGKTQTNWAVTIALLVIGGAFMIGGFAFVTNIASGGKKTIEDLGQVILPMIGLIP